MVHYSYPTPTTTALPSSQTCTLITAMQPCTSEGGNGGKGLRSSNAEKSSAI